MEKKKIGIISCFDMNNVNFGNRLQACALNTYINNKFESCEAESIYFKGAKPFRRTKKESMLNRVVRKIDRKRKNKIKNAKKPEFIDRRLEKFNRFSKTYTRITDRALSYEELGQTDYDIMIVGSDVVWQQWENGIQPIMFLDFNAKKNFKKISYAASFATDYIPNANIEEIKRCLTSFDAISVRESSSVKLLEDIGISNAEYVLDPTFLLSREDWKKIEKRPEGFETIDKPFIFSYMLGENKEDRAKIEQLCKDKDMLLITVPYASGRCNNKDENFGDVQLSTCSPEEWIWLIHYSQYFFTDSFHGVAFSIIFNKRFVVTKRKEKAEMNNRMLDILKNIGRTDLFMDFTTITDIDSISWEYDDINEFIQYKQEESRKFLEQAIVGDI